MEAWGLALDKSCHVPRAQLREPDASRAEPIGEKTPDERQVMDDGHPHQRALAQQVLLECLGHVVTRGVTLTDFVVSSVHEAAVRTLEARHVIELSQSDQRAFVDALSRPPAPKSVLRKAWARHSASAARSRKRRCAKRARRYVRVDSDRWLQRRGAQQGA
jgi:hypothetical protein